MTHGTKSVRTSERTKQGGESIGIPATPNSGALPRPRSLTLWCRDEGYVGEFRTPQPISASGTALRSLSSVALSPAGSVVVYLNSGTAAPAGAGQEKNYC